MADPAKLYTVDAEVRAAVLGTSPVLVHLLDGYVDAGQVGHQLSQHLLSSGEPEVLARFDHDALHDYRSRRPQLVFDQNTWVEMNDPDLILSKAADADGRTYLLLTGPEPDMRWRAALDAVLTLAEDLEVSELVTAHGIPMAVPHTRPTLITAHATDPGLAQKNPIWIDRVTVPGSFSASLEFAAGQRGICARGFVAHVPHYLAPGTYAPAALAIIERLGEATGLELPPGELATVSMATLAQLEEEVSGDGELGPLVVALQEQYDELVAGGGRSVPSAEEIGAVIEQFLAERDEGNPGGSH